MMTTIGMTQRRKVVLRRKHNKRSNNHQRKKIRRNKIMMMMKMKHLHLLCLHSLRKAKRNEVEMILHLKMKHCQRKHLLQQVLLPRKTNPRKEAKKDRMMIAMKNSQRNRLNNLLQQTVKMKSQSRKERQLHRLRRHLQINLKTIARLVLLRNSQLEERKEVLRREIKTMMKMMMLLRVNQRKVKMTISRLHNFHQRKPMKKLRKLLKLLRNSNNKLHRNQQLRKQLSLLIINSQLH